MKTLQAVAVKVNGEWKPCKRCGAKTEAVVCSCCMRESNDERESSAAIRAAIKEVASARL